MLPVLPAAQRKPSFSDRLGRGVGKAIEGGQQLYQQHQQEELKRHQQESIRKLMGENVANLPPELQKLAFQSSLKGQESNQKSVNDQKQKSGGFQIALQTVDQMRNLRQKGNLGRGSAALGFFGGETAKDRGEYETLGNSLISYASNIPIRNRLEFEKLAGRISDPSTTDAEAEGILDGLERIISGSLSQYENAEEDEIDNEEKVLDENAMNLIYRKAKGDKNEAMRIAKKMGYKI